MAREAILVGKAWQSVSWLVLGEAAGEAAAANGLVLADCDSDPRWSAATYSTNRTKALHALENVKAALMAGATSSMHTTPQIVPG